MIKTSLLHIILRNLLASVVWTVSTYAFEDLGQHFYRIIELYHILFFEALFQLQEIVRKLRIDPLKHDVYHMLFEEWKIDELSILVVVLGLGVKVVVLKILWHWDLHNP
jgi:hypothetical protein